MGRLCPSLRGPERAPGLQHPERLHIGFQDGFLLGALVGVLLAQPHDGAQRLDIKAVAFRLGIDVADIVGNRLLFFFQSFDTLNDGLELVLGESCRGLFLDGGSSGGHRLLLSGTVIYNTTSLPATAPPKGKTYCEKKVRHAGVSPGHPRLNELAARKTWM